MGGMRMKVLHIGEYVQGGVATYIKTLLMHPQHPEIEDFLICSDKNSEHHWPMAEDHVTYYPYHRSLLQILPAMLAVRKEIRRRKPDVVYCHSTWSGLFARFPMLFLGKPCRVIYNAHGWTFLRNTAEWKKKIYDFMERCLLHATDAVINVSNYEYHAALHYSLPEAKMKVIYSGISGRKGVIDEALKHPAGCINLLFVGRFDPLKGVDYLLEQLSQCHRDDLHLTVIGDNVIGGTQIDLPELIKNGENGFTFSMETRDSLKNVLDLLDKNQLRQMGYKAEKLFSNNFQAEEMLTRTIKSYCR